jgi:Dna[CI] antecedent, DciA
MERLGGEIRHALRGVGVPDVGALAEITRVWPGAVGDAISRAAWPLRLSRDGTLHVATVSAAWSFELTSLAGEVLDKLRAVLPDGPPTALRFAPGPVPAPAAEPRAARLAAPPPAGPRELFLAAELTASLSDAELRRMIARAAAASLAREAGEGVPDRRF